MRQFQIRTDDKCLGSTTSHIQVQQTSTSFRIGLIFDPGVIDTDRWCQRGLAAQCIVTTQTQSNVGGIAAIAGGGNCRCEGNRTLTFVSVVSDVSLEVDFSTLIEAIRTVTDQLIDVGFSTLHSNRGIAVDVGIGIGKRAAQTNCGRNSEICTDHRTVGIGFVTGNAITVALIGPGTE